MSDHLFRRPYYPDDYCALSVDDKKKICNGAGPASMGWLVPDTICGMDVTECANMHDFEYHKGKTAADKLTADLNFFSNMFCHYLGRDHRVGLFVYIKSLLFSALAIVVLILGALIGIFHTDMRRRMIRLLRFMWIGRYYYAVRYWGDKAFWSSKSQKEQE